MADEDAEEKTEAPSERVLTRARDEGDLPLSRDAPTVGALFFFAAAIPVMGAQWIRALRALATEGILSLGNRGVGWSPTLFVDAALPVAGLVAAAAGGALVAGFAQTGGGMWPEKILPDLTRIWNSRTVSRVIGADFWIDMGVGLVKLVVMGGVAWKAMEGRWEMVAALVRHDAAAAWMEIAMETLRVLVAVITSMVLLTAGDVALTRFRYMRRHRMTKEEIKRENREDEGDPLLKSRRKSKARELARNRVTSAVPKADVIVVNPTHIAVAISYDRAKDRAPRVVAKGKGAQAQAIRDLANQHGVPVVEDIPLARLLYKRVKVGREVPAETFRAVASVLAFVYRVTGRSAGGRAA